MGQNNPLNGFSTHGYWVEVNPVNTCFEKKTKSQPEIEPKLEICWRPPCLGPTGPGKTRLQLRLANRRGAACLSRRGSGAARRGAARCGGSAVPPSVQQAVLSARACGSAGRTVRRCLSAAADGLPSRGGGGKREDRQVDAPPSAIPSALRP